MNLAVKLRELRKEKGYTQTDLAKLTGLATSCISMIEIGQREASAHTLYQLAKVLNVSSDYLLGLEDDFGNITVPPGQLTDQLNAQEKELLDAFNLLGPFERDGILVQVKALAKMNNKNLIKK